MTLSWHEREKLVHELTMQEIEQSFKRPTRRDTPESNLFRLAVEEVNQEQFTAIKIKRMNERARLSAAS